MILNWFGLALGMATFLIIGLGHVVVIKGHYHFGVKCWPIFLLAGLAFAATSLFVRSQLTSGLCGIGAFALLWGIVELFHQQERVEKGWFPRNPNLD